MINKKEFALIKKDVIASDKTRENAIQSSRIAIQASKKVIYAVHRNKLTEAKKYAKEMDIAIKKIPKGNVGTNMPHMAFQEKAEALLFLGFVEKQILLTRKDIKVDTDEYLLGLCDLTGELMRFAINSAIRKDTNKLFLARDLVDSIYGEMMKLDLRNGEIRKKFDSIKYNLIKIEDTIYDLKIRGIA